MEKGPTVLISSHILSELYQLATKFGIIHRGQLMEELTAQQLDEKCRQYLRIKVDEPTKGVTILEERLATNDFEVLPDGTIKLYSYLNDVHFVSKTLTNHGLIIEHLSQNGDSLENYFTKLVGGEENE